MTRKRSFLLSRGRFLSFGHLINDLVFGLLPHQILIRCTDTCAVNDNLLHHFIVILVFLHHHQHIGLPRPKDGISPLLKRITEVLAFVRPRFQVNEFLLLFFSLDFFPVLMAQADLCLIRFNFLMKFVQLLPYHYLLFLYFLFFRLNDLSHLFLILFFVGLFRTFLRPSFLGLGCSCCRFRFLFFSKAFLFLGFCFLLCLLLFLFFF